MFMKSYSAQTYALLGSGSGILVMIGWFTMWAAFLRSGLMVAAYWIAHGTKASFPLVNGGELAAL